MGDCAPCGSGSTGLVLQGTRIVRQDDGKSGRGGTAEMDCGKNEGGRPPLFSRWRDIAPKFPLTPSIRFYLIGN